MSDEIVSRLFKSRKKMEFLAEDVNPLYEADEEDEEAPGADDEYAALNDESDDYDDTDDLDRDLDIEDDSTAPEQGSPDDPDPIPHGGSSHTSAPVGEEAPPQEEAPAEETPEEESPVEEPEISKYENPLDNQYAVKFTLGDDISLVFSGKTNDQKIGVIDGYDPEGFYRVRWMDGTTTNGLTDIALSELVKTSSTKTDESRCVCGSTHIIRENNHVICDDCGREIKEDALDALTIADKNRPAGKKMIRSVAHPVSTSVKPNIVEAIKKAFSGTAIREDDDPEISPLDDLEELSNEFWTRQEEMRRDIEELGYTVDEMNAEYIVISSEDDEDENAWKIPVGGTSRSMTLDLSRAKSI